MSRDNDNKYIDIRGARVHNLKNIDLKIPHNQLVVITGLSGSGKSTLAFDTIYAEGQRRYVESLSSYARQFLGRMSKQDVDSISGIAPAIAIEQKVNTHNPRSTVGTSTEIYDYLKLLFARIGRTYSPISGNEVKAESADDVARYIMALPLGTATYILAPIITEQSQSLIEKLTLLVKDGLDRLYYQGGIVYVDEVLPNIDNYNISELYILISRLKVTNDSEQLTRITDSIQTAMNYGNGACAVATDTLRHFSSRFECDGIKFEQPTEHLFSFNNPLGACPRCEGYGKVTGIDEDLVVPNKNLSIYENCIACWRGETMGQWRDQLVNNAARFDFPIHKPYRELTKEQRATIWKGNQWFHGLDDFFTFLHKERYKIQYRVMLSRYTGKTTCPDCDGNRLNPQALYIKIGGLNIAQMVSMSAESLKDFFDSLTLSEYEQTIAKQPIIEIKNRLQYLIDVGLSYLTLDRLSSSLSGGESQRINLACSLGSSLVGSLYILDEPSIGLHPRDTELLIHVLKQLRDLGNTVIVVEHDANIMAAADTIIDIGPMAGEHGGEVVFCGSYDKLLKCKNSLTAQYLTGKESIAVPSAYRKWRNHITLKGVCENNLKGFDVKFPLGVMTCVTGVSGSGKSSLVKGILYPALKRQLLDLGCKPGNFAGLEGDLKMIARVEMVDQNPIGKSSRSNPATYIKAYDEIRKLFAEQHFAKINGMNASHFSFNMAGGRCDECEGEGRIRVSMQFMADVELVCESCGGKRFKDDVLEVRYRDKNIYDVLEMPVDEAIEFFSQDDSSLNKRIVEKLSTLQRVGLGYVKLGQSSSTLSGGESQRVKLAAFLQKESYSQPILFIFDEPTTGLHFHDIKKLLDSFNALISNGHTIVIVEHNPEVIKCADWIIDLGPDGGEQGGELMFEGTPNELKNSNLGYTYKYI